MNEISVRNLLILSKHFQIDTNLPIKKLMDILSKRLVKRGTMPSKLDISNQGITSLTDYFASYSPEKLDEIEELDCSRNKLTSLEGCHPNLKKINCSNNQLTNLVGCTATFIICENNNLLSLKGAPEDLDALLIDGNPKLVDSIWSNLAEEVKYIPATAYILEKLFKKACDEDNLEKATIIAKQTKYKKHLMDIAQKNLSKNMDIIKMLHKFGVLYPDSMFSQNNETSRITQDLQAKGIPFYDGLSGYIFIEQGIKDTENNMSKRHYKIHLQPKDSSAKRDVIMRLIDLFSNPNISSHIFIWKYSILDPDQLLQQAGSGALNKLFPSIVVYPKLDGDPYEHATIVLNAILRAFPNADDIGFNLNPRYNIRVNSLVYYAGGDGDIKEGEPELFDDKKQLYKDQLPLLIEQEFAGESIPVVVREQGIHGLRKRQKVISIRKIKTPFEPRKRFKPTKN